MYTSQYKYVTTSREFRKQRVAINAEEAKMNQLTIGGEGLPMLSLMPAVTTREISPKFTHLLETNSKPRKSQGELSESIERLKKIQLASTGLNEGRNNQMA
jgi:hypothetical protein